MFRVCRVQDEGLSVQGFSLGFRVLRVFRAYLEFCEPESCKQLEESALNADSVVRCRVD